ADHPVRCAKERTTGDDMLDALGRRYGLLGADRREAARRSLRSRARALDPPVTLPTSPGDLPTALRSEDFASRLHGSMLNERPKDASSPVIAVDHQACILCDRCIRACDEIQCNDVIGRTGKGYTTRIGFDLDDPMGHSTCVSCGECVAACPTGALTNKALTLPLLPTSATKNVESVCPYCGVGCALTLHVDSQANKIIWAE